MGSENIPAPIAEPAVSVIPVMTDFLEPSIARQYTACQTESFILKTLKSTEVMYI
jgi:hypothetical protein